MRRFQQANGLLVDGIVGPNTWFAFATTPTAAPTIRRKIAKVSQAERDKLRNAILELDRAPARTVPGDGQPVQHRLKRVQGSASGRAGPPLDGFDDGGSFPGSRDDTGNPADPPPEIRRALAKGHHGCTLMPPSWRLWAPPENQQQNKNCKHPTIVEPPRYED